MDADFSHDPADLPRLVEEGQRADLVIGSRYVRGGGVSGYGFQVEMTYRTLQAGFRVTEVPITSPSAVSGRRR